MLSGCLSGQVLQCLQCPYKTQELEEWIAREILRMHNTGTHPPAAFQPGLVHEGRHQDKQGTEHSCNKQAGQESFYNSIHACNTFDEAPSLMVSNTEKNSATVSPS